MNRCAVRMMAVMVAAWKSTDVNAYFEGVQKQLEHEEDETKPKLVFQRTKDRIRFCKHCGSLYTV